jgi:hypothetical protein
MWSSPIVPIPGFYSYTDIWISVILGYTIIALMGYQLYSFLAYRKVYYASLRREINAHELEKTERGVAPERRG